MVGGLILFKQGIVILIIIIFLFTKTKRSLALPESQTQTAPFQPPLDLGVMTKMMKGALLPPQPLSRAFFV